jgi:hypothetical protein
MSSEYSDEHFVEHAVNKVFTESYGGTVSGRITMAAFAIGPYIGRLRVLEQEKEDERNDQIRLFENYESGTPLEVSIHMLGFTGSLMPPDGGESSNQNMPETIDENNITRSIIGAKRARDAAVESTQVNYNLSKGQAKKALELAEKEFWLFNIPLGTSGDLVSDIDDDYTD